MKKGQFRFNRQTLLRAAAGLVLLLAVTVLWPRISAVFSPETPVSESYPPSDSASHSPIPSSDTPPLEVFFLDVDQADCILILQNGHALLIDAGGNKTASALVEQLTALGVTAFDVVIGTHPHEDHIGGLDAVIDAFPIRTLIMPEIEHDTKTFRDVLTSIENAGLLVTTPRAGDIYPIGEAALTILYDQIDADSLNNCSVVARLDYANRALMLTGDAEAEVEEILLSDGTALESDFLKVGHHGSRTSSSEAFLQAVNPYEAFISCGIDNSYNHPHEVTLEKLAALANTRGHPIGIHRTDLLGTIHLTIWPDGYYEIQSEKEAE